VASTSAVLLSVVAAGLVLVLLGHLRRKGRHGLFFAGLLGGDLAVTVAALAGREPARLLAVLSGAGFVVLVLVPGALRWGVRRALARGEPQRALGWHNLRMMLQPGAGLQQERGVLRLLALTFKGSALPAGEEVELPPMDSRLEPEIHVSLLELVVAGLAVRRQWGRTVEVYDQEMGAVAGPLSPGLAAVLIRPLCETGDLARAADFLQTLSRSPLAPKAVGEALVQQGRLMLLAHLGDVHGLREFFEDKEGPFAEFPEAGKRVWLGVAQARGGDLAGAMQVWREVVSEGESMDDPGVSEARARLDMPPRPLPALSDRDQERVRAAVANTSLDMAPQPRGSGWRERIMRAPVTLSILAVMGLVHLAVMLWGSASDPWTQLRFGGNFALASLGPEPWRLITSVFLHGGLMHLGFNAYGMFVLGLLVERLYGSRRLWLIFFVSGVVGSVVSASMGEAARMSVGASGGIFGVFGAALVGMLRLRGQMPEAWRRQILVNMVLVLGLNLALGFSLTGVDNAAHLGGLVGGLGTSVLLIWGRLGRHLGATRRVVNTLSLATLAMVMAAALMAATTTPGMTLSRLPRRTLRGNGLSVSVPAHWSGGPSEQALVGLDPLMGTIITALNLPTLEAVAGKAGAGESLTAMASLVTRSHAARLRERADVGAAVVVGVPRHLEGAGQVMTTLVRLTAASGERATQVSVFKRFPGWLAVCRLRYPGMDDASMRPLVLELARSLRLDRTLAK